MRSFPKWLFLVAGAAILLLSTSCATSSGAADLDGDWKLVQADGLSEFPDSDPQGFVLKISGRTVTGSMPCNSLSATFKNDVNRMEDVASTVIGCDKNTSRQELAFLKVLEHLEKVDRETHSLLLQSGNSKLLFEESH